jgi:hypothetical protein
MNSSNTLPTPQLHLLYVKYLHNNCRYLKGLKITELKEEEDMPMAIDKQSSEANKD